MEKKTKSRGISLSQAIAAVVKESVKQSLYQNTANEEMRQRQSLSEEDDDLFGDDEGTEGGGEDKKDTPTAKSSKTIDDEKEKLKKGEVETKDIVDKLNVIRGGRSFKEEPVSSKLDEYVSSLSKAEKVALLAYLKGLSQIVTGEVDADAATDPADPEPDVEMTKGKSSETKKKTLKANVIKAPSKEKSEKKPSAEDSSGPVPITPKK